MKRLRMIWWVLTKKDVCMVVRTNRIKDYDYETTTSNKRATLMAARLFQYCYSALYRKEIFANNIFKVEIPQDE